MLVIINYIRLQIMVDFKSYGNMYYFFNCTLSAEAKIVLFFF